MTEAGTTQIGKTYRFNYPEEFTSLPEYSAHRGQLVTVIRPCTEDEADELQDDPDGTGYRVIDTMMVVQASDGWIGHAWDSELDEP